MKAANKCVRTKDRAGLAALGFSETTIDQLFEPDFCGHLGFADYQLTNNNANIRRMKQRVKEITERQNRTQAAENAGGVTVEPFGEYCRVTFAEKPERNILDDLRAAGFRWGAGSWSGTLAKLPESVKTQRHKGAKRHGL